MTDKTQRTPENALAAPAPTDMAMSGEARVIHAVRGYLMLNNKQIAAKLDEVLSLHGAAMKELTDRMERLEKQLRLHAPMTPKQVRYLNAAIRQAAAALLMKRSAGGNRKAMTLLCNRIRKAVLVRYGVGALYEIPRHEYPVALSQIETWDDAFGVREVIRRAAETTG